jgi:hypothetical protein
MWMPPLASHARYGLEITNKGFRESDMAEKATWPGKRHGRQDEAGAGALDRSYPEADLCG